MKIRVALAEDNEMLALSIREKLELFADELEFCFRAANASDLLDVLREEELPDVILMDIEMPEMDGIAGTREVKKRHPQIKIVMLTVFDDEEKIFLSIQAGANGYLLKDETPDKIYEGIKMIMAGGAPMSPTIAAKSLNLLRNPIVVDEKEADADYALSKRQVEVLEQLSQGLDYQQIAANLYISPATVRKHIENIYEKLQVHNKMQAVQKARRQRLI